MSERRLSVVTGALLLLLGCTLGLSSCGEEVSQGSPVELRERVLDLTPMQVGWKVLSAPDHARPRTGIITAVPDPKHNGGDMPSLIVPPGCEVSLKLPAKLGDVILTGAAATDRSINKLLRPEESVTIHFRAWIDDQLVFDEKVKHKRDDTSKKLGWRYFGEGEGLRVRGGSTLRLSTSVKGQNLRKRKQPLAIQAGFGGLSIDRISRIQSAKATPGTPNIIMIVMDTLRADRCSTYGYERETTPHLSRLAARGTTFEQAHATSSWTWPSTASILTGLGVEEHGVRNGFACYLAHAHETLAEALARRGYHTGGFSGNPLISSLRNFDQGFESFMDSGDSFRASKEYVPDMLDYIRDHKGEKFFLYAQLIDTHDPPAPLPEYRDRFDAKRPDGVNKRILHDIYFSLLKAEAPDAKAAPPKVSKAERRWISNAYDASVATGDHWLGQILDILDELELTDDTLVVFTSDHGEELFDHGFVKHGHSLHTEHVAVPLVIAGPGVPAGQRVTTRVSNRHMAPTLARFGGAHIPTISDPLDLLLQDATQGGIEERDLLLTTHSGWIDGKNKQQILGLRQDGWSLHYAPKTQQRGERILGLYNLDKDPLEHKDLSRAKSLHTKKMLDAALAAARAQALRSPSVQAGGASTEEMLRKLGYAGDEDSDSPEPEGQPEPQGKRAPKGEQIKKSDPLEQREKQQ